MRDRIKALKSIPLEKLRGFSGGNPKTYKPDDRAHLAGSIEQHGYVQPIIVREVGDGTYEIVDGHHRNEVLVTMDPDAKIKCIVLDVESVAEGRRILLALQRTSGFDMDKLEEFVSAALADGTTAAELMADTGMTGADLDALARAGSEFLDGIGKPDDETNEGVSRAGLLAEHVQFAVPLTRDQSTDVHRAIKLAKQLTSTKASADALSEICRFYLAAKTKE